MSLHRSFSTAAKKASQPRFRSALKKLSRHGIDALKPALVAPRDQSIKDASWRPPMLSNRIAKVIRKQAIRDGTYGTFENGTGWDSAWDVELSRSKPRGQGRLTHMRVPKLPKYQRTREERARKIEEKMEGMDERMDQYHMEKQDAKPAETFENLYKKLMQVKK